MRLLVGVLTIALTNGLEAQSVRGELTDSVSRAPRAGAFLTLVVYRAEGKADTAALAPAPPPAPPPVVVPAQDTGRPHRMVRDPNVLTSEEFQGTTATDALGLVQHYRPNWLHYRGPVSILNTAAGILQVYVDGSHLGDWNRLHEISARDVQEMRFYSGPDATMRHGVGNAGGAIEIQTR